MKRFKRGWLRLSVVASAGVGLYAFGEASEGRAEWWSGLVGMIACFGVVYLTGMAVAWVVAGFGK